MEAHKLWEFLKYKIKEKCIFISSNHKKKIRAKYDSVLRDIENIQQFLTDNPDDSNMKEQM